MTPLIKTLTTLIFLMSIFPVVHSIDLDDHHKRELEFSHAFIVHWIFPILDKYIHNYDLQEYHLIPSSIYFQYIRDLSLMETIKIHNHLGLDRILEDLRPYSETPYLKDILNRLEIHKATLKTQKKTIIHKVGHYKFDPERKLYEITRKKYLNSFAKIIHAGSDLNVEKSAQEHTEVINTFEDIALNTNFFFLPEEHEFYQRIEKALETYLFFQNEFSRHHFLSLFLQKIARTFFKDTLRITFAIRVKPILNFLHINQNLGDMRSKLEHASHPHTLTVSDIISFYRHYMKSFHFDAPIL
jgi:hypothetical protein